MGESTAADAVNDMQSMSQGTGTESGSQVLPRVVAQSGPYP